MPDREKDAVKDFLDVYGREEAELLDAERFSDPRGSFSGEAEFIELRDREYDQDKSWVFELKPENTAVIVVDLQEDFVNPDNPMCVPEAYRQIPRVKALIEGCHEMGMPVLFTEHTIQDDCAGRYYEYWDEIAAGATKEGEPGTKVYSEIAPVEGQRVIAKHSYDAFAKTNIDYVLRSQGIQTVIICGTLTNYCCEGTARGAFSHQYDVVFGSDVCATNNPYQHEATLRTMRYGFARVMDHKTILRVLKEGDDIHEAAVAERKQRLREAEKVNA